MDETLSGDADSQFIKAAARRLIVLDGVIKMPAVRFFL
jgi:hypothetical protein